MHFSSIIPSLDDYISDEERFLRMLDNPEAWRKIPLLNYLPKYQISNNMVVRFRGMIQDMLEPEIYLERYEVIDSSNEENKRYQNGKYRDYLQVDPKEEVNLDSKENMHGERRAFFVVSLPGINSWASMFEEHASVKYSNGSSVVDSKMNKRIKLDQDIDMENESELPENAHVSHSSALSEEYLLNSPISSRPSKACMVKVYNDFDSYPLNSIVDIVGFLSIDSVLDYSSSSNEMENDIEYQAQNPPSSLIPRLHAISVKKLSHNNPLLDINISEQEIFNLNFAQICKDLKIILTQCLFGDDLAAEYLLLHLISTVYVRSEINSIGKFTLNICHLPTVSNYTQEFYKILELLLPASHHLPMTLESLNTLQFFPKKDYETNKLVSGILQLAPMTHFVLDETLMTSGILDSNGIRAMQNLSHLIKTQQIKCDFSYYDIEYNVDIPILILSEGKSILPNDFLLPLKPDSHCVEVIEETLKAVKYYLQPKLDGIRRYITSGKISNFSINRNDSDNIEADFVEMRKHNTLIGADELHNLLLLSRLLAISNGEKQFNTTFWEKAKEMEELRKSRIQNMPKSSRHP